MTNMHLTLIFIGGNSEKTRIVCFLRNETRNRLTRRFLSKQDLFFFQYGISGPFWYAAGATIQILIFAMISIQLKIKAPGAKTFLQVGNVYFSQFTRAFYSKEYLHNSTMCIHVQVHLQFFVN